MDNLTHDEIELGPTGEFTAAAERERERLEEERATADRQLTEAQTAVNRATARHQSLERLLGGDPAERGHAAEFVKAARSELKRLDDLLTAAEQQVAEAQEMRDRLVSQLADLNRLLTGEADDVDAPDAPRADADAVLEVLVDRGKPMHFRDIYAALADVGFKVGGADPASTLLTRFYDDGRLERVARGTYQLYEDEGWVDPEHSQLDLAEWVLQREGEPLRHREIARRMIDDGHWSLHDDEGSIEELDFATYIVSWQIAHDIKQHGDRSRFRRVGPVGYGTYEVAR